MKTVKNNSCSGGSFMSEAEKYEELRKYFESAEEREQGYIVTITKQQMKIKALEKELEKAGVGNG